MELDLPPVGVGHWRTQYDVSPDGRTFYLLRPNVDPGPREIRVVMRAGRRCCGSGVRREGARRSG